jgi:hypothetical protein
MTFMFEPANEQMNCASARGSSAHLAVTAVRRSASVDTDYLPNSALCTMTPPSSVTARWYRRACGAD